MHDRIMKNIDLAGSANMQKKAPAFIRGRYISVAACLVLLFVGALIIYSSLAHKQPIVVMPGIVEYGSIEELSDAVGFKVPEVTALPFIAEQTAYTAYGGKIAQVAYTGKENTLIFRISKGSEDNSGDYTEYTDVKSSSAGDDSVTIKGEQSQYCLGVWENGAYSYSLNITNGISEEEMIKIVLSVQ